MHALNLAIFRHDSIALAAHIAQQRRSVKGEIESLGECAGRVRGELDLFMHSR